MTERLEALRLAVTAAAAPGDIVPLAEQFHAFLSADAKPAVARSRKAKDEPEQPQAAAEKPPLVVEGNADAKPATEASSAQADTQEAGSATSSNGQTASATGASPSDEYAGADGFDKLLSVATRFAQHKNGGGPKLAEWITAAGSKEGRLSTVPEANRAELAARFLAVLNAPEADALS